MLVIRFTQIGKTHQKVFRLAVQEKKSKLNGKSMAYVGTWNPRLKKGEFKAEEIKTFIKNGAGVSDSAWNLLVSQKVIEGEKRKIKVKAKKEKKK